MYSTVYIIGSVLVYFWEILPSYEMLDSPTLKVAGFDKRDKRFRVIKVVTRIILVCGKINLGVCALLYLLKCMGLIPWW